MSISARTSQLLGTAIMWTAGFNRIQYRDVRDRFRITWIGGTYDSPYPPVEKPHWRLDDRWYRSGGHLAGSTTGTMDEMKSMAEQWEQEKSTADLLREHEEAEQKRQEGLRQEVSERQQELRWRVARIGVAVGAPLGGLLGVVVAAVKGSKLSTAVLEILGGAGAGAGLGAGTGYLVEKRRQEQHR